MSKTDINEVEINGVVYTKKGAEIESAVDTDHVIVIAQRGWIFEGYRDNDVEDKLQLLNANVVRSWSNGKGIGGLTKKSLKGDYTLDEVGQISFPHEGVIAVIDITEW